MTTNEQSSLVPFLARFEALIPKRAANTVVEYDEKRMILLVEGKPAALQRGLGFDGGTKHTFVQQETTDDD